jgi:hypothetical protein
MCMHFHLLAEHPRTVFLYADMYEFQGYGRSEPKKWLHYKSEACNQR